MDISQLSDSDLLALHNKDYSKMSNEGLQFLHQQGTTVAQPINNSVNTTAGALGRSATPTQQPGEPFQDSLGKGMTKYLDQRSAMPDEARANEAINSVAGSGATQASGDALANMLGGLGKGIRKGGDMLLQRAVGIKRYIPGVGETLANEGVIGTKGIMRGQIENGLESRGQQIGDIAKSIPEVSTQPVAEQLGTKAAKFMGPDGEVVSDNIKAYHKYLDAANQASQEGTISGETAAFRRSQYGKVARDAGRYRDNPAQGLKAQLAGDQQLGYSQALKSAPGATPELAEADKAYGHLSAANKAMSTPESLSTSSLIGKFLPTSLAESTLGRGLIGAGKGLSSSANASSYTPQTLAELLSKRQQ